MIPIWLMSKLRLIGWAIVDNWKVILIGVVLLLAVIGLFSFFRGCGGSSPKLDEKQIQDDIQRQKQRNDEELYNNLEISNQKQFEIEANIKAAEENTNAAKSKSYSNTNLSEAEKARCKAYPERCK